MDMLLNYLTLSIAAIAFVSIGMVLLVKGKRLSPLIRSVFGVLLGLLLLYFVFVVWVVLGMASSHPAATPMPVAA